MRIVQNDKYFEKVENHFLSDPYNFHRHIKFFFLGGGMFTQPSKTLQKVCLKFSKHSFTPKLCKLIFFVGFFFKVIHYGSAFVREVDTARVYINVR